jgi:multidrug transporter EmrE-like cation transporter
MVQARKTFQKLIYVSNLVFGDRQAAFLLPWTRVFGLTDAQASTAGFVSSSFRVLFLSLLRLEHSCAYNLWAAPI